MTPLRDPTTGTLMSDTKEKANIIAKRQFEKAFMKEGLDGGGGGVWNSLISKNLAHYSLSLKFLLIL